MLVLLAVTALVLAAPAGAARRSAASQRSRAAGVMAQLDRLEAQRDAAAQREAAAKLRLSLARAAVSSIRVEVSSATTSLTAARQALAQALVANYKAQGEDAVAYVLAAGSFSDLVSRVDTVRRVAAADHDLIDRITRAQQRLRDRERTLEAAAADAAAAAREATSAREQLDGAVARTRSVLAGVDAAIRSQLSRERARRTTLSKQHDGSGSDGGGGSGGSANVFYGDCTWYGPGFAGHHTADGEIFDPSKLTAASPWLPFNTELKVTNLATGLSVQVRVNDRGPFGHGVLDLSAHAAKLVHLSGWQRVRIQILPGAARPAIMP
jgi:hypothetical protein